MVKYTQVSAVLVLAAFLLPTSTAVKVECPVGQTSCECPVTAKECEFDLTINYLQTFASYSVRDDGTLDPQDGYVHFINSSGQVQPLADGCPGDCSPPQTVDGRSFRTFFAINGITPGPSLIVTHLQTVIANVHNKHPSESITIHWHGQLQYNTPWMDGVPYVSHCPIQPGDSFRYIFKVDPSGTFWYHGHVGAARVDGLYGALIIRERDNTNTDYQDLPQEHTILLADWWQQPYSDLFTLQHTVLEAYYPTKVGELPNPQEKYDITVSYDEAEGGPVPYFSSLVNGKGYQEDVPVERRIFSRFDVTKGQKYRFRVIAAQSIFPMRLSIDGHKLTLIAADGFLIQPIPNLDYIILHAAERYDIVVNADQTSTSNYWIRAETLEINITSNTQAPYDNFNHQALAVLHYQDAPAPFGPELSQIPDNPPDCTRSGGCLAANCPFEKFHDSYNIACLHPAQDFRLLNPTPNDLLPNPEPDEGQEYFFNFGYSGEADLGANINGRLWQSPTFPPSTQPGDMDTLNLCPTDEYTCFNGCKCTNMLELPFRKTVRFVLTSIGEQTHPIHLHGHSFWVVESGYGTYNSLTGFKDKSTNALSCLRNQSDSNNNDEQPCTTVRWRDGYKPNIYLNSTTPRKDTILVPAGSYVVIQFRTINPGYWFFHCHIEEHLLEGMAMIVAIDPSRQNPPPEGMRTCGNFNWTLDQFTEKLKFDPAEDPDASQEPEYCQCLRQAELIAVIICSIVGFIFLVVLPITCCSILCCLHCGNKRKGDRFEMSATRDPGSDDNRYSPLNEEK